VRLLIFIVAYRAEKHIISVFERIPQVVLDAFEYEILLIDDASPDRTYELALEYEALHPELELTTRKNARNLGYGGNQKLGYQYAIDHEFDLVILLHGDGQYAPEAMADMLAPLQDGSYEYVMGSRMLRKGGALKGGMPIYKFVGNKILTATQNFLLRTKLSEFHSGYRAFAVAALSRIPFQKNSDDFHFDTQIIIQLLFADAKLKEVPIPTFYGDEISYVNGVPYALQILRYTLLAVLHAKGCISHELFAEISSVDQFR